MLRSRNIATCRSMLFFDHFDMIVEGIHHFIHYKSVHINDAHLLIFEL